MSGRGREGAGAREPRRGQARPGRRPPHQAQQRVGRPPNVRHDEDRRQPRREGGGERHGQPRREGGDGEHRQPRGGGGRGARPGRDGRRGGEPERGRGGGPKRPQAAQRTEYLTDEDLNKLANSTGQAVVEQINTNEAGFYALFRNHRYLKYDRPLRLKQLVKVLYNLVTSAHGDNERVASQVLAQIFSSEYAQFTMCLSQIAMMMPLVEPSRQVIRRENPQYLMYLIDIGHFVIDHIPSTVAVTYPLLQIEKAVEQLQDQGESLDVQKQKIDELKEKFDSARQNLIASQSPRVVDTSDDNPPEPFRDIEVLPTSKELTQHKPPFLRPNKIKGGYSDWEHYLDVQFRLLREDFVAPLRKGIRDCYEQVSGQRPTEIRLYSRVHVLSPVCLYSGIGFNIRFDTTHLNRVNWEHSRRLIFGSLLCLSKDHFHTMIFATVVKRDPDLLVQGLLTVKFEGGTSGFDINPGHEFAMVESTAYFEAYRHVLDGLQSVATDSMPFKRFIVDCELQDIPLPSYLRSSKPTQFNLKDALGIKSEQVGTKVAIADPLSWPHHEETCLDKSQLAAIQMALKQEISVIQGPPGTGKTYIGLKIVQAFLQNRKAWDCRRDHQILVVCYTNHALDQFLEGIKDSVVDGKEPNIVRIGGRCKSEKLANCVLSKKLDAHHSQRIIPGGLYRRWIDSRHSMLDLKKEIDHQVKDIDSSEGKVLKFSAIASVIPEHIKFQLTEGMPTDPGKEIEVWLDLWKPQPMEDESEALARAMALVDIGPAQPVPAGIQHEPDDVHSDDEDYIEVEDEARLLQEDRMLEGEQIELVAEEAQEHIQLNIAVAQPDVPVKKKDSEWQVVQISKKERKRRIDRGFRYYPMRPREARAVEDVRELSDRDRWRLYHYWTNQYLIQQKSNLSRYSQRYNMHCEAYTEAQQDLHNHVVKEADVIGMTTTGAAKHSHILRSILPRIVVVEEAAEVFESHVVTSLSPSVQQLILIGDHKQLRPKPNYYKLEQKYSFAVSLFERLAKNGIPFTTLEVQHRMRPEIAHLVHPHIYPHLENHPSVTGYEHIKGVGKDIFFIDHVFPEESKSNGDMRSHMNIHEVEFLIELCSYLLKQGYKHSQITILTMYRGQLLELKRRMKRDRFDGVRVTAVDDFQGEENDIVLLSLVRSNSDGDVGFLKIQNRVCVSLSRARMGLYVIGNLAMLRDKDTTVWPQIIADMEGKQCIGKALPLYCQNHPDRMVNAKVASDFNKCPEGGCREMCEYRLQCGHKCRRICHPYDPQHLQCKCYEECTKTLSCGHKCKRKCYECTEKCQPCGEPVLKVIPGCGHRIRIQCHINPTQVLCTHQCTEVLSCGHHCQEKCHEPCTSRCRVKVPKSLPCGHKVKGFCYQTPENIICSEPCGTLLDCEHPCKEGTCGRCHQGRLHIRCQRKCDRQLVCGHTCKFPCTPNCPPCMEKCTNYCVHSQCHKECYQPCAPCMEPCPWQCVHLRCTSRCGEPCNRPPCNEPCTKLLRCGDPCIGLCGEKCPQLCLVCNRAEVLEVFFGTEEEDARYIELQDCGHVLEVKGLDRWLEVESDNPSEVQLKKCPKCNTPIRKSLRYGNTIKQTLRDMEEVKKKQLIAGVDYLQAKIQDIETNSGSCITEDLRAIKASITPPQGHQGLHHVSPHVVNTIENQLNFLPQIAKMHKILDGIKINYLHLGQGVEVHEVKSDVSTLQQFLMQTFLSSQQLSDIQCELRRLSCLAKLCDLQFKVTTKQCQVSASDRQALDSLSVHILESGWKSPKMKDDQLEQQVTILIKRFNQIYSISGLSEKERIEIVQAIGLAKGHWFKCPNGHYYCIGECGGAMQIATCPDCGARIGGTQHTLLAGNQLAREMDGASHPSWSDAANMENYQIDF